MKRTDDIEKRHMTFCKIFLGVHSKASNLAVYSELGRYPLVIDPVILCLKYLNYVENNSDNEFLKEFFKNVLLDGKLCNNCTLIKFRSQLSKFLIIPVHA